MTEQEKQEMAEFLAVDLFGVQIIDGEWWFDKMADSEFRTRLLMLGDIEDYIQLFFSPDGFFAVWDKVEEKNMEIYIFDQFLRELGADRYEAFYKAVREAWE